MINYDYLRYWYNTDIDITTLIRLVKENIFMYEITKEIKYIEYLTQNIQELARIIPIRDYYYTKIEKE